MVRLAFFDLLAVLAAIVALVVLWTGARRDGRKAMNKATGSLLFLILLFGAILIFLLGRSAATREPGASAVPTSARDVTPALEDELAPATVIPAMFQGSWATDQIGCRASGPNARLEIGEKRVEFDGSSAILVRAAPLEDGREYAVTLAFTNQGQGAQRTLILRRVGLEMALRDEGQSEERLFTRC